MTKAKPASTCNQARYLNQAILMFLICDRGEARFG